MTPAELNDWTEQAEIGDVPPFPALDAPPNFGILPELLDVIKTTLKARGLCIMQQGETGRVFVARRPVP